MRVSYTTLLSVLVLVGMAAVPAAAVTVNIVSDPEDASVYSAGEFSSTNSLLLVGRGGSGTTAGFSGIGLFELPNLAGGTLKDANLQFTLNSVFSGPMTTNVDLYGLGYVNPIPGSLPATWLFAGANDTRDGNTLGTNIGSTPITKIASSFVAFNAVPSPGTAVNTDPAADLTLLGFVQSLYDQGAQPGDYAVFRLNLDAIESEIRRYQFNSANAATGQPLLTLEIAAPVPEPSSLGLAVVGLGMLMSRRRRRA